MRLSIFFFTIVLLISCQPTQTQELPPVMGTSTTTTSVTSTYGQQNQNNKNPTKTDTLKEKGKKTPQAVKIYPTTKSALNDTA